MNMVAKVISQQALGKLEQLGLSNLLNLLGERGHQLKSKVYVRLVGKIFVYEDSNQIELKLKDGVSMYVTEKIVHHFLDWQVGEEKERPTKAKDKDEEYFKIFKALKKVRKSFSGSCQRIPR
jgi:hypothetical protein